VTTAIVKRGKYLSRVNEDHVENSCRSSSTRPEAEDQEVANEAVGEEDRKLVIELAIADLSTPKSENSIVR
jgi:hypothetical protein